jgi:hypothetical protein
MRFTLFSLALLLILSAPHALAAAASCRDGAKVTVDGTVTKAIVYNDGAWLFIETSAWDCGGPIYLHTKNTKHAGDLISKSANACRLGSHIRASGTFMKPDSQNMYEGWGITDQTIGKMKVEESFTCDHAPALNPKLNTAFSK